MPDSNEISNDIEAVTKTVSSVSSTIKLIMAVIALGSVIFGLSKGCSCIHLPNLQVAPTKITNANPNNIVVAPNSVTYTPAVTKANPNPKPVTVYKPIEAPILVNGDTIIIPHLGFCLEPFVGYSFTIQDQLRPYVAARLIYWNQAGLQLGLNDRRVFAGLDYRLPIADLMIFALGVSSPYGDISFQPYAGLDIQLSL